MVLHNIPIMLSHQPTLNLRLPVNQIPIPGIYGLLSNLSLLHEGVSALWRHSFALDFLTCNELFR